MIISTCVLVDICGTVSSNLKNHPDLVGEIDAVINNSGVAWNCKRKLALESDIKGSLYSIGKSTDLTQESDWGLILTLPFINCIIFGQITQSL